jgi:DNA modification methylase
MTDTKAQKEAFADTWSNVKYINQLHEIQDLNLDLYKYLNILDEINVSKSAVSYLTTMALRIIYMHRKLKSTGSFYLHCDPTMSHYLKVVCDLIFGFHNFLNEIAWCYKEREISKRRWNKKHDILLFYSKNSKNDERIFNVKDLYLSYSPGTIKKFTLQDEQGRRFQIRGKGGKYVGEQGLGLDVERDHPEWTYRDYLDEKPGILPRDWFDDIPFINRAARERLGYPTQKPEALLERIISASSNEGDVVADFFCGCGTAVAVAQKLNRRWIGVDISHLAVKLIYNRLLEPHRDNPETFRDVMQSIEINGFPRDIATARELATGSQKGRLKFQDWIVEIMLEGVSNPKKVGDGGYDGYLTLYRDAKVRDVVLIEVKSGNVTVKNIREFIHVVNHEKAVMGVFVCFEDQVTKPMRMEAQQAGYYDQEAFGVKFPSIQILTVEDLFEGKTLAHPNPTMFNVTFKKSYKQ